LIWRPQKSTPLEGKHGQIGPVAYLMAIASKFPLSNPPALRPAIWEQTF
jgi:hypothetical protein